MAETKTEDSEFKVEDKRRFDADGNERPDDAPASAEPASGAAETAESTGESRDGDKPANASSGGRPTITFSSFVVGLATQALAFLGAIPNHQSGQIEVNLEEASAMIDLLGLLQQKTAGNLAEDEERMMEEMLYDLRMRYVAAKQSSASAGSATPGTGTPGNGTPGSGTPGSGNQETPGSGA